MRIAIEHIGSGPYEESLAAVGDQAFSERNLVEALAYARQIKRVLGEPPPGTELGTGSEILDAAVVLWSVRVTYDRDNPESVTYMRRVADGLPSWDIISLVELSQHGLNAREG